MSRVDVTLGVKNAKFKRGMEQAKGQVKSFRAIASKGFNFRQAAGMGALLVGLDKVTDRYDKIHKLALRLSTDVETIQRLEFIGSQNRVTLDEITNALTRLNRKAAELENSALQKAFKGLNIDAEKFQNIGMEERLKVLADSFNNSKNQGLAFKHMFTLLEDDAKKLVPLLKQGSGAIEKLGDKATVASKKQVEAMVAVRDELDAMKNTLGGWIGIVLSKVIRFSKAMVVGVTRAGMGLIDALSSQGRALKQVIKGNFRAAEETMKASAARLRRLNKEIGEAVRSEYYGEDDVLDAGAAVEGGVTPEAIAQQQQVNKLVEERLKFEREIAELQEDQRDKSRTTAEKLAVAEKRLQEAEDSQMGLLGKLAFDGESAKGQRDLAAADLEVEKALMKVRDLKGQLASDTKAAGVEQLEKQIESLQKAERDLLEKRDFSLRRAATFSGSVDRLQSIGLGAGGVNFTQDRVVTEQRSIATRAEKQRERTLAAIETLELTIEEDEF